jgi:hypothetical protein
LSRDPEMLSEESVCRAFNVSGHGMVLLWSSPA